MKWSPGQVAILRELFDGLWPGQMNDVRWSVYADVLQRYYHETVVRAVRDLAQTSQYLPRASLVVEGCKSIAAAGRTERESREASSGALGPGASRGALIQAIAGRIRNESTGTGQWVFWDESVKRTYAVESDAMCDLTTNAETGERRWSPLCLLSSAVLWELLRGMQWHPDGAVEGFKADSHDKRELARRVLAGEIRYRDAAERDRTLEALREGSAGIAASRADEEFDRREREAIREDNGA